MFKLIGLKWKREFEQLKALHEIEMAKQNSALAILSTELTKKHELSLLEATSLLKLDYQQQIKQKELDYERKINELKASQLAKEIVFQQKIQDENYVRLKDAMTKLHEEGNVTTKFTQDLALKMLGQMPVAKSEHKYLSGDLSIDLSGDPSIDLNGK